MNLQAARVIGFFSLPSPSLAEANPTAYTNAMRAAPDGAGSCAHCGTGILHHIIVECEGERAFIGSQCAERIGGPVARCASVRLTSDQLAERDAESASLQAAHKAQELTVQAERAARIPALKPLGDALRDGRNGFCDSVASELCAGIVPSGRAVDIVCDILAKRAGRAGSKAYCAELDRLSHFFYTL